MVDCSVDQALELLQRVIDGLDPDTLDPAVAMLLTEEFSRIERICAAGKALTDLRVADSGDCPATRPGA